MSASGHYVIDLGHARQFLEGRCRKRVYEGERKRLLAEAEAEADRRRQSEFVTGDLAAARFIEVREDQFKRFVDLGLIRITRREKGEPQFYRPHLEWARAHRQELLGELRRAIAQHRIGRYAGDEP